MSQINLNMRHYIDEMPNEFKQHEERIMSMVLGDQVRLIHRFSKNGEPCSIGKDASMSVIKYDGGWWWRCFRCDEQGWVSSKNQGPSATLKQLEHKPISNLEEVGMLGDVMSLPYDAIPMEDVNDDGIPIDAWQWLWTAGLQQDMIDTYAMHWSPAYNRIIIPIHDHIIGATGDIASKLIGWCGRCPYRYTKGERAEKKRPKYLTKKLKKTKRAYFMAPKKDNPSIMIVVEDCLSAIKVAEATNMSTIALLNKSISNRLIMKLRGLKVIVWLDFDAKQDAMKAIGKMNMMGVSGKMIATHSDPKMLPANTIKKLVHRRCKYDHPVQGEC